MTNNPHEIDNVLQDVWAGNEDVSADADCSPTKVCRNARLTNCSASPQQVIPRSSRSAIGIFANAQHLTDHRHGNLLRSSRSDRKASWPVDAPGIGDAPKGKPVTTILLQRTRPD